MEDRARQIVRDAINNPQERWSNTWYVNVLTHVSCVVIGIAIEHFRISPRITQLEQAVRQLQNAAH